jgi:DNA topoisomerase-3
LWLDNDREGENICFEVLDCVYKVLNRRQYRRVYRARFYSLVDSELLKAYEEL